MRKAPRAAEHRLHPDTRKKTSVLNTVTTMAHRTQARCNQGADCRSSVVAESRCPSCRSAGGEGNITGSKGNELVGPQGQPLWVYVASTQFPGLDVPVRGHPGKSHKERVCCQHHIHRRLPCPMAPNKEPSVAFLVKSPLEDSLPNSRRNSLMWQCMKEN